MKTGALKHQLSQHYSHHCILKAFAGWPGVKIRLTRRGAEHIKSVGIKILNEEIPRLSGFKMQHSFSERGVTGDVQLSDIRVLRYSPPQYTSLEFVPPAYLILQTSGIDITLAGRFTGIVALLPVSGSVTGDIRRMTVRLRTQFKTAPDGLMQVKVIDCFTVVEYSHFFISADGPLNSFVQTIERLAYTDLSDPFRTIDTVDNLVIEKLLRRFIKGLYVDNRNIADPIITPEYFETQQKGEIRYKGDSRPTPFNPPPMRTGNDSSRMLHFYGSQYLFNSLLYHAYEDDRMIVEASIDETVLPLEYKSMVRTSCGSTATANDTFISSLCLGTLIPEIANRYPNRTSSFLLLPHQVPEFQLSHGVGSIDLKSRILTHISEGRRKRQVLMSAADLQADLRLLIENQKFAAALKLNKFDIR
ncbi:unnamed protein product [Gongylonema pulchrum]|uniref:BPI2 domain-containing protein n=1 Tax=Gongylonema pulchrum TaxID=637853 RepID=A0A183CYB3_9BILA|nr:unnamed protein product [Gongylonema pulchrum]